MKVTLFFVPCLLNNEQKDHFSIWSRQEKKKEEKRILQDLNLELSCVMSCYLYQGCQLGPI